MDKEVKKLQNILSKIECLGYENENGFIILDTQFEEEAIKFFVNNTFTIPIVNFYSISKIIEKERMEEITTCLVEWFDERFESIGLYAIESQMKKSLREPFVCNLGFTIELKDVADKKVVKKLTEHGNFVLKELKQGKVEEKMNFLKTLDDVFFQIQKKHPNAYYYIPPDHFPYILFFAHENARGVQLIEENENIFARETESEEWINIKTKREMIHFFSAYIEEIFEKNRLRNALKVPKMHYEILFAERLKLFTSEREALYRHLSRHFSSKKLEEKCMELNNDLDYVPKKMRTKNGLILDLKEKIVVFSEKEDKSTILQKNEITEEIWNKNETYISEVSFEKLNECFIKKP